MLRIVPLVLMMLVASLARGAEPGTRTIEPGTRGSSNLAPAAIEPGTKGPSNLAPAAIEPGTTAIPISEFKLVESESGDVDYFSRVEDPQGDYLRASYKPPYKTALYAWPTPEDRRRSVAKVRWKWRAITFPKGGNECAKGKGDSAAVVYLTWRRALRWYTLKYVWSPEAPKNAVCASRRNPFVAQDTIIVESGGPLGEWRTVELDPDAEFRKHFEGGDATAKVPDFGGIGLMTDGDQTQSPSCADYGGFGVTYRPEASR